MSTPSKYQADYSAVTGLLSAEEQIVELAKKLAEIHGPVHIRKESSGVHLLMACPKCLAAYGRREMKSRHLQLNADKLFKIGEHRDSFLPHRRGAASRPPKTGYAQCMKEHGPFTLDQMLGYPTLKERGIDNYEPRVFKSDNTDRYLIPDGKGHMIPDHPGEVIPLTKLSHDHPALAYLAERDYDPIKLYQQFRASWCVREAPEGKTYNRFYRKHDFGWKSTPQGRIVFYSDVCGQQVCWQARYLELPGNPPLLWHPYAERWLPRPPWPAKEGLVKYTTATGALRNNQLCGYDHVTAAASVLPRNQRVCVLTEGPLDAARFPDRGLAVLGKFMSEPQAILVKLAFDRAVLAFDADAAGRDACEKASVLLARNGVKTVNFFTKEEQQSESKVDVGMLGYAACEERVKQLIPLLD